MQISIPFEIEEANGITKGSNGMVTMACDEPCRMRRRRSARPGLAQTEMLYAEMTDGLKVYARQKEDGGIVVIITKRQIYA